MKAKKIRVDLTPRELDLLSQCVGYFISDILKQMFAIRDYDADYLQPYVDLKVKLTFYKCLIEMLNYV